MMMGVAATAFILRLIGGRRRLMLVRMATMARIHIGMMMGVPGNRLVGMMQFHGDAGSQHVDERDNNEKETL